MKFTAFNGSPAGEKSAAGRMLGVFLAGAARAGAETELYHLGDYSIGQCVQHDDMEKLLHAYQSADVVCLDSPVYSWNMTALLKNLRPLIPLKSPLLTRTRAARVCGTGRGHSRAPYTTGCAADVSRRVCTVSGYVRQRETVLAFGKEPFLMCAIVSDGMIWEVKLDQTMPKKQYYVDYRQGFLCIRMVYWKSVWYS